MAEDPRAPFTRKLLKQYGLESLWPWAVFMMQNNASEEEVEMALWDTKEFQARFKGIFDREKNGWPPISPEEYLDFESTVQSLSSMWNIPIDKEEIDEFVAMNKSAREVEERFSIAAQAVYQSPIEDREEAMRLYGITEGRLAKYWMEPKRELPLIQQQFIASQIAGSAKRVGYNPLTASQAERLQQSGLTGEKAMEGFTNLLDMAELFDPINLTERAIGQQEQVELLAGDAKIGQEVEKRARTRVAEFAGGGGFAAGQEGFKGIGSAES